MMVHAISRIVKSEIDVGTDVPDGTLSIPLDFLV